MLQGIEECLETKFKKRYQKKLKQIKRLEAQKYVLMVTNIYYM